MATPTQAPEAAPDLRDLVCSYAWDCSTALSITACESGFNPSAVSPTDDWGLMQLHAGRSLDGATYAEHFARHGFTGWRAYFEALGWGWFPLDAEWNVAAAYHIWERGGWSKWNCSAGTY